MVLYLIFETKVANFELWADHVSRCTTSCFMLGRSDKQIVFAEMIWQAIK